MHFTDNPNHIQNVSIVDFEQFHHKFPTIKGIDLTQHGPSDDAVAKEELEGFDFEEGLGCVVGEDGVLKARG